jgi:hypothetical protein
MSAALRMPDFLCIGAMRCGTTTLWDLLAQHPRIFVPATKELHFFDDREGAFGRGVEAYAAHFADAPPSSLCGESSPSYLFVPGTAERIKNTIPEARLLAILRDPVARAWSHYWFNVRRGREWLGFEKALDREGERTDAEDPRWQRWFAYVARGRYVEQLRRYEAVIPREQLCVVLLEELLADPTAIVSHVLAHIGLESDEMAADLQPPTRNRVLRPRSLPLHRASVRLSEWGAESSSPVRMLAQRTSGLANRINLTSSMPPLQPTTRARLAEAFASSNEELADWLGRPLPWTTPDRALS